VPIIYRNLKHNFLIAYEHFDLRGLAQYHLTASLLYGMYPLERFPECETKHICQQLWKWALCNGCLNDEICIGDCPSVRIRRLAKYFEYYRDITRTYFPEIRDGRQAGLRTHVELLNVIGIFQSNTDKTRAALLESLATWKSLDGSLDLQHKDDGTSALNLVVKITLMINCGVYDQSAGLLEAGTVARSWQDNTKFSQFFTESFPTTDIPALNDPHSSSIAAVKSALLARKLKKHAGISFQPTDDICHHLRLNQQSGVLQIFHNTSFLKEHLRITRDSVRTLSVADSLKQGALPRQLVLEILDSIQKILFPLSDPKSRAILQSLTTSRATNFDPDCLRFESSAIRRQDERNISYFYFGSRLMALYDELENPTPRSWMEKWLERRSAPRYVMMATLLGVIFAVLLGLAGLAVASYQTWITYQQWKHPIPIAS
jgi:hypothetical protein